MAFHENGKSKSYFYIDDATFKIYFSNLTLEPVKLIVDSLEEGNDGLLVPVGYSSLCLCAYAHLGSARLLDKAVCVHLTIDNPSVHGAFLRTNDFATCTVYVNFRSKLVVPSLKILTQNVIRSCVMGSTSANLVDILCDWFPPSMCHEVCAHPLELQTIWETSQAAPREASAPPYSCVCAKHREKGNTLAIRSGPQCCSFFPLANKCAIHNHSCFFET